jgi:hypothetical protein
MEKRDEEEAIKKGKTKNIVERMEIKERRSCDPF